MKFFNFLIIIFISLTSSIKADLNENLINQLEEGGKLIFIRHAYAPGSGDPNNFNLNDCSTQRNLSEEGKKQAKSIGKFFIKNKNEIDKVLSSEWCRCKETAKLAFNDFETFDALNSFYAERFSINRPKQINDLKEYINNWQSDSNLIIVTHYVVIDAILNRGTQSGEMIISDKNLSLLGSIEIN